MHRALVFSPTGANTGPGGDGFFFFFFFESRAGGIDNERRRVLHSRTLGRGTGAATRGRFGGKDGRIRGGGNTKQ